MKGEKVSHVKGEQGQVLMAVAEELTRAGSLHPALHSAHEGFAVILEEVDELKAEVWKRSHDKTAMRKEAIQIAAMAIRFVVDVCGDEDGIPMDFVDNDPDGGHACEDLMGSGDWSEGLPPEFVGKVGRLMGTSGEAVD